MLTKPKARPLAPRREAGTDVPSPDARIVLHGISWAQYSAISAAFGDRPIDLTYLEGALEIMSPGETHEDDKTRIARLLEAYTDEAGIMLEGYGAMTTRREAAERGLEPDECYTVGRRLGRRKIPDLAIEVEVTRPAIPKLEVYRGLGVPEVWLWRRRRIEVWRFVRGRYEARARSELLPGLDLELVASLVRSRKSQTEAVRALRERLRGGR